MFHTANRPSPQTQKAARRRAGSGWARAKATVSSVTRCAPRRRASLPRPRMSATARLKAAVRVLSSRPVTAAATGPPPASSTPTALNWAEPAYTTRDIATGTHTGRPPVTAIAPKETPTTPLASQTSALSRTKAVRSAVRMFTTLDGTASVRQGERSYRWSEQHVRQPPAPAPPGLDRRLSTPRTHPRRALPLRAGQARRNREVHALPAGGGEREPQRGDAVGAGGGARGAVQCPGGTMRRRPCG